MANRESRTEERSVSISAQAVAVLGGATPAALASGPDSLAFGTDPATCRALLPSGGAGGERPHRDGVIWRDGADLWVRNLSLTHDLSLVGNHETRVVPRGRSRQLPPPPLTIHCPGGWNLTVEAIAS